MVVHLEGMGVNGCLLATLLEQCGVDFTWHDTRGKVNAWSASTGAIYPANSAKFGNDWACWQEWSAWHNRGYFGQHLERCHYWFSSKKPPHEGKYKIVAKHAGLNMAAVPSYHLDAQGFVHDLRARYKGYERKPEVIEGKVFFPEGIDAYIITHGFGARLDRAYWGWTRHVELEMDEAFHTQERAAFYFRPNKFVMAYAYPIAGTDRWYAGSSLHVQKPHALRDLDPRPKYERWKKQFLAITGNAVRIKAEHLFYTGWRPAAAHADQEWVREEAEGVYSLRPLWNSGIRHFPQQWFGLVERLGLSGPATMRTAA